MSSRSSSVSHCSSHRSDDSVQLPPKECDLLTSDVRDGAPAGTKERQSLVEHGSGEAGSEGETANLADAGAVGEVNDEEMMKESSSGRFPSSASHPDMVSLFIGLGPNARQVDAGDLRRLLEERARDASHILDVRHRGRCAFADVSCKEEAEYLISELNGFYLEKNVRLTVQASLNRKDEQPLSSKREREVMRREEGRLTLFIGLGPNGKHINNDQLWECLSAVIPYVKVNRRHETCAFVDVNSREDALKLIDKVNNMHLGEARLSVQISRERKRRREVSLPRYPASGASSNYYPKDRRRDDVVGGGGRRYRRTPPLPFDGRRGAAAGPPRSHGDRRVRSRSLSSRSRSDSRDGRRHSRRRRYSDDSRGNRRRVIDRQRDNGDRRRGVDDRHRHRHHRRTSSSRSYSSRSYSSRSSRSSGGSVDHRRKDDRRGGERRVGGAAPPFPRR